jgi:hypothetical protein
MIEECKKARIFSSLSLFSNHPNLNLSKKHNQQLYCYVQELKKENLDGWFTSIENKNGIEVSVINDSSLFRVNYSVSLHNLASDFTSLRFRVNYSVSLHNLASDFTSLRFRVNYFVSLHNLASDFTSLRFRVEKTEKLRRNWTNGNSNEEGKRMKKWGRKYMICTVENPAIFHLHERFEKMIEEYQKYEIKSGYLKEYCFQVLLNNAIIQYHKGDIEKIEWKC